MAQSNAYYFEDAYMKCYNEAFKDNGKELLEFFNKAEANLAEANILKGISSKSYVYFLNNSGTYTSIDYKKLGFFNFAIGQLNEKKFAFQAFKTCTNNLKQEVGYQSSKLNQVEEVLAQIETATNVQDVTSKVAKILTLKDLEHIYYRMRIINFLEMHGSKNIKPPNEKEELSEIELKNALQIDIKAQDEIIVKNKSVSFGELLQVTKTYAKTAKSNTIIALKVKDGLSKQFIEAIKQQLSKVIDQLQNQEAEQKYQLPFAQLTEKQQEEIQKIYPKKIVRI
jgi:hypothetical protein